MSYKGKYLLLYVNVLNDIRDIMYHSLENQNGSKSETCSPNCIDNVHEETVMKAIIRPFQKRNDERELEGYNDSSREASSQEEYNFYLATLNLDAHLASSLVCEFSIFPKFRKRFFRYVKRNFNFNHCIAVFPGNCSKTETQHTNLNQYNEVKEKLVNFVIEIIPIYPKQKVDYAWTYRIGGQTVKKMLLEEAFAWFSTLGGAYSSLGDHFLSFAEQAGKIAMKQLKIAEEEGDPVLACKAKLFFAQSLMQRGYIVESGRILRTQYKFAKSLIVQDTKLLTMCRALRKRWKYVKNNAISNS